MIGILLAFILTGIISSIVEASLIEEVSSLFPPGPNGSRRLADDKNQYLSGFYNGLRNALGIAGFATAIKIIKHWYEKEYLNTVLQKEKVSAELLTLKAQLHPHFLFNTLNNIYSSVQNTSPEASRMIEKLSDMLRYILYECDKERVLLRSELDMLEDFIALESIRYNDNFDLKQSITVDNDRQMIAPLLLLPLVENCFKHGSSRQLENPWINIQVQLKENNLSMKLINGKPEKKDYTIGDSGIGITNVQKRLNLLYPGKHHFTIIEEADVFIVILELQLTETH